MKRDSRRLRHQDVWEILPWYVNGTLDSDERTAVEAHLDRCSLCRNELAASQELASAVRRAAELPPVAPAAEGRRDVHAAPLDAPSLSPAGRPAAAPALPAAPRLAPAVRWALALQAAAILALALGLAYLLALPASAPSAAASEASYRTLAAPPASDVRGVAVRVVFSPTASEEDLRGLLLAAGAHFADGPSPAGVYTLEIGGDEEAGAAALERLRRDPRIELAEPVVVRPPAAEAP